MTYALSSLLNDSAMKIGRQTRRAAYRAQRDPNDHSLLMDLRYVVHVEKIDGTFTELDAESRTHAGVLAKNVIRTWDSAERTTIRKVLPDGSLSSVLHIYDFRDLEEGA